jgi:hypothetical protein
VRMQPDAKPPHWLRREFATMVLYVAVVLMAAIAALPAGKLHGKAVAAALWGAAIGLAVAHWFAFHVSAQLFAGGRVRRSDLIEGAADAAAALGVALIATIPLLFTKKQPAAAVALITLAGIVAVIGYVASRRAGVPRRRAALLAVATMAVGVLVAALKSTLDH